MKWKKWVGLAAMSPMACLVLYVLGVLVYISWLGGLLVVGVYLMIWLFYKGLILFLDE